MYVRYPPTRGRVHRMRTSFRLYPNSTTSSVSSSPLARTTPAGRGDFLPRRPPRPRRPVLVVVEDGDGVEGVVEGERGRGRRRRPPALPLTLGAAVVWRPKDLRALLVVAIFCW